MSPEFERLLAVVVPSVSVIVAAIITSRKLNAIHVLVNSRLSDALERIENLEAKLRAKIGEK